MDHHIIASAAACMAAVLLFAEPASAAMNGIDVSGWQTDSVTCTAQGYDFAVVKATEGTGYRNPKMAAQLSCAQSHGKRVGVYHYADGGNAVAEADFFVSSIGGWRGQALLALDFEMGGNGVYYSAQAGNWIRTFVTRVHSTTGVWPLVYVPESGVWKIPSDVRANCGLWPAAYASNAATGWQSNPWHGGRFNEAMRQYSSQGVLAGYAGRLDLNVFYGSAAAWDAYARGGSASPAVKAAPAPSAPAPAPVLDVDGFAGHATIRRWQHVMGTPEDGVVSGQLNVSYRPALIAVTHDRVRGRYRGSALVRAVQRRLGVRVDGLLGPATIRAIQRRVGVRVTGVLDRVTVRAIQYRLNQGWF